MSRQPLATHPAHHGLTGSGSWKVAVKPDGRVSQGRWQWGHGAAVALRVPGKRWQGLMGQQWLSVSPGFAVSSGRP